MLKKLRHKKTAKRIWITLLIFILPAFVFWGFGSFVRSRQESSYVGKIFGRNISVLDYKDALDAVRNQAIIRFGDQLSEMQKYLNLESQAWDRLILVAEAKKRKINASDKEIVEAIKNYPFFQRNGQFDNDAYSELLQYVFHTQPRIFEEQTRQNLMLSKLYKEITDNIHITEEEIKKEYQRLNEQISIYYIASLHSNFAKDIAPVEKELRDYFAKKSFQFKQPLSFNLEYISLASASEDKDEETIKNKINRIFSRLNKKEDFAKVAKDFNLAIKETGLFNQADPIPTIGWSPQILSLIDKLKVGEYLPPIKMDKYYYISKLKERKEPYIPDFESIKDRVKEKFISDKSKEMAKEKIENCLKKLKELYQSKPKSVVFNKIAEAYGLKSDSTDLFKYGSYIEGVGASDNFFMQAQNLKEDNFSEAIEMPSGFYIIKIKSRIPIDEKKFAAEKDEFSQNLLSQKKQEYFVRFIEELKRRTQSNLSG